MTVTVVALPFLAHRSALNWALGVGLNAGFVRAVAD